MQRLASNPLEAQGFKCGCIADAVALSWLRATRWLPDQGAVPVHSRDTVQLEKPKSMKTVSPASPSRPPALRPAAWQSYGVHVALVLLTLGLLEQARSNLLAEFDGNLRLTATLLALIGSMSLAVALCRLPASLQRFFWMVCVGSLTLPLWASTSFAIFAYRQTGSRIRLLALGVLYFAGGYVNAAIELYGFGGDTFLALLQTNALEAIDFALASLRFRFLASFAIQMTVLACLFSVQRLPEFAGRYATSLLIFTLLSSVSIAMITPARDAVRYVRAFPRLEAPPAPQGDLMPKDMDVILILGESTSRWHWQLYGYPYPTTPRLLKRRDAIVAMTDAVSTYSHTLQSISDLMLRQHSAHQNANQSLIGELKATGVRTTWFSAQSAQGPWDSPIRAIAAESDRASYFVNRAVTLPKGLDYTLGWGKGNTADLDMADEVVRSLSSPREGASFTVAHLATGHTDYCRSLPHSVRQRFENVSRGERYFGNAADRTADVNCYDSGMTLVDEIVDQVIAVAQARARPTVVIFAPDHGEDPDGGTGHSSAAHSARHVEIPLIFYWNDAARRAQPQEFARLKARVREPFTLPWLHESILDIFGLGAVATEDMRRSIVAEDFKPGLRTLFHASGVLAYDELTFGDRKDYLSRARLAVGEAGRKGRKPRLFAHRNDSELALLEGMHAFDGVELDVVFDEHSGHFDVVHPPAASTGFTLERALEIAQAKPGLGLWFDWKNLTAENVRAALDELDRLDRLFAIKRRVWVETQAASAGPQESRIADRGYQHAYYLAPSAAEADSCRKDAEGSACLQAVDNIVATSRRMRVGYVSFDKSLAPLATAVLRRAPELKALTWDLSVDASVPGLDRKLLRSPQTEIELIRLPSSYWR